MSKELYIRKIEKLTDDRLKELLQLRTAGNSEIMELAITEAIKRGIDPETIEIKAPTLQTKSKKKKGTSWTDILAILIPGPDGH